MGHSSSPDRPVSLSRRAGNSNQSEPQLANATDYIAMALKVVLWDERCQAQSGKGLFRNTTKGGTAGFHRTRCCHLRKHPALPVRFRPASAMAREARDKLRRVDSIALLTSQQPGGDLRARDDSELGRHGYIRISQMRNLLPTIVVIFARLRTEETLCRIVPVYCSPDTGQKILASQWRPSTSPISQANMCISRLVLRSPSAMHWAGTGA
jgi:hypothetical protein